ncbi:MAG TPA: VIT1/CCC1 transporter family protein [Defluviitoga sp.]|nr:VIT1/CCC1 transporter family protein [Defluviitoga sp.]HOP24680.1 VIT1/CCC1 transporter family protein [Defluviitoga sp.]HPZ29099.1 VIT1/CCC1 transporter family protein [Defluviitoga sp.]HQD63047.1 VIT1/CCC1 transporter family protein [Defluviitoga sp.]
MVEEEIMNKLLIFQKNEITEYMIYKKIANSIKDEQNKKILEEIAEEELKHYNILKNYTQTDVKPNKLKVTFYVLLSKILGLTFSLKLMERGEERAQTSYKEVFDVIPEARKIEEEEEKHEAELLSMIEEERLNYTGSIVLGLNDALVELTGALAGLTFALQNGLLIASSGLITGIAASLSMAASEYLSQRAEGNKNALKSATYTGISYIITVVLLILPYLIIPKKYFLCLILTLAIAVIIILGFNFYISVAKDLPFKKRFLEMASISFGVAGLTFFIGFLVRITLGIEI